MQERHQAAIDVAENERELSLLINRLEDFSAKVKTGLADLDRTGMRQIIRILVRRIEIDNEHIEIIFRVPPLDDPGGPKSPSQATNSTQHCTADHRPSPRQHDEADLIGLLPDDFDEDIRGFCHALTVVSAVGPDVPDEEEQGRETLKQRAAAVAILNVGWMRFDN
jgi:site-specific DNA recombinase